MSNANKEIHMPDHDAEVVQTVAAMIREVDGNHQLGAAALAEALVNHGVTIKTGTERRTYAVATKLRDGTTRALSTTFPTPGEAAHELAVMLGDDYYRDQHPSIATTVESPWVPVDEPALTATGRHAPAATVLNPAAIGDPEASPILRLNPSMASLIHQRQAPEHSAPEPPEAGHAGIEPTCPECGHAVPIVSSRDREGLHWARHTITGSLTSSDGPECENSGDDWEDPGTTDWTPGNQSW
jgi:hypothetical protein